MGLIVKDHGGDFQPAPEGMHIARCYGVIDLGIQINKAFGNSSPKVLIAWELGESLMADGRPFIQMQTYTSSISQNSKLRGLLEAWRGKGFSMSELMGFELRSLLGVPCYLTIKHTPNPQSTQPWASIISICKLPSIVTCPPAVNPHVYFDLDHYSEAAYMSLSSVIRKKINLGNRMAPSGNTLILGAAAPETTQPLSINQEEVDDLPF